MIPFYNCARNVLVASLLMSENLEARIVHLETIVSLQDRMLDELNEEILRLNRLYEKLMKRFETFETRQENASFIRPLSEETPPPHY